MRAKSLRGKVRKEDIFYFEYRLSLTNSLRTLRLCAQLFVGSEASQPEIGDFAAVGIFGGIVDSFLQLVAEGLVDEVLDAVGWGMDVVEG